MPREDGSRGNELDVGSARICGHVSALVAFPLCRAEAKGLELELGASTFSAEVLVSAVKVRGKKGERLHAYLMTAAAIVSCMAAVRFYMVGHAKCLRGQLRTETGQQMTSRSGGAESRRHCHGGNARRAGGRLGAPFLVSLPLN